MDIKRHDETNKIICTEYHTLLSKKESNAMIINEFLKKMGFNNNFLYNLFYLLSLNQVDSDKLNLKSEEKLNSLLIKNELCNYKKMNSLYLKSLLNDKSS